jgi:hypothetical protein
MKRLKDQHGLITIDFIFAITLVFGMTMVLFSLSLSLSVIEVTQYITFAVARNYHAAHIDPQTQTETARQKYVNLVSSPALKPLFTGGWFVISKPEDIELGPAEDLASANSEPDRGIFTGARVALNAKALEIRIPFFGTTFDQEDGFATRVSSFIGREPSTAECMGFNQQRFNAIISLDQANYGSPGVDPNAYAVMGDNGC